MLITVLYWKKKHTHYKDEHKDLLVAINDIIPDINADRTKRICLCSHHHAGKVSTKMQRVILSKICQR
jgi:hypothetical protein